MKGELFGKYIWLVQTFIKAGDTGLDLAQISRRWELRFGSPYPRRSFSNHREAIEALFGIRIECDRSTNRYFIRYSGDVSNENANASWLVNTFTVNSLLTLGKERLSGRVAVEDIPSGQRWLTGLMDAMMDNRVVRLAYRKYSALQEETLHVYPYAGKEAEKRWYLVGFCQERDALRVYGLDRILSLDVLDRSFRMPEPFDVDDLFAGSYGVYLPEGKRAEEVRFRTSEKEARFLRDLPLHFTQRELPEGGSPERPVVFSLRVIPNEPFLMKLASYGDKIEVLSPESLRGELARRLAAAVKLYENKR